MAAHARARLSDPGRGIRRSRSGDLAASARARGRSLRVGGRSALCTPRADHTRGRRAQVRSSAGPGMERPSGAGHDPRRRVRLERLRLPQPFAGRQGGHRHELEWAPLLWAEGGEEWRVQQKEERHVRTEPIPRYWHVPNAGRIRARNAESFVASRNEEGGFNISERLAFATDRQERTQGPSSRLAQGPAICFGPSNGATWDCRSRFRLEPNSADPSRSVQRAANPPCHHQKCARPRLWPLDLMGPGNGILRAETGGRVQAQNAGERPEFGSQTALRPAN